MKNAIIFPGQGSQYVGMGLDLYENSNYAKEKFDEANEILGYSLSSICFEGPLEVLKETRYTQPALFTHSAILFDLVKDKIEMHGTAGHSVGEYASLYAAGVLSFEEGLKLVSLRGELMFSSGIEKPGTMYAIIGLDDNIVEEICKQATAESNNEVIVPANYNCPSQLVVSGSKDLLHRTAPKFKDAGAKIVKELVVSGAFHSPLLQDAANKLSNEIHKIDFQNAKVPVYLNTTSFPEQNGQKIKEALIQQLTSPVLWSQILKNMNNDGFNSFYEVGAGNVLQGLVKRTLSDVKIYGFDKFENLSN
ncbi:MAG: ACP S-malonyltransferase [Candidatus Kapaibacteriota bacterium]